MRPDMTPFCREGPDSVGRQQGLAGAPTPRDTARPRLALCTLLTLFSAPQWRTGCLAPTLWMPFLPSPLRPDPTLQLTSHRGACWCGESGPDAVEVPLRPGRPATETTPTPSDLLSKPRVLPSPSIFPSSGS